MLLRLWRSGVAPAPVLQEQALLRAAVGGDVRSVGDEQAWREPLQLLLRSLREEADLNPLGRTIAHAQIVDALRARRRARALWRRHPEIAERSITAPVIVLGQMRSGTTRIHRLLACDHRFAHTRLFETLAPVPFGPPGSRERRAVKAWAVLTLLHALNPALAAIHPTGPYQPEEEFGLYNFSFASAQFEAQWRVPSFSRWWETAPMAGVYAEFAMLLRTIGWHRRDPPGKTWLLKAPQFMQDLDALIAAFPGARLICLHRDPAQVVASSASLVWNQMRVQSDAADPNWIGAEWLRKTRLRQERAKRVRHEHPQVPQIDVDYEAVGRDWRGEMRRIYSFLGYDLQPETEARMEAYLSRSKKHLGHAYSPELFGLPSQ
jgi:hypothetical protein